MLNKKGFTLVELLAMMVVLGIIMVTIIPNIVGISNSNRLQTYAEDAKKFKSIVEYKMRSDNTYMRPSSSSYCVAFTLENAAASEFDKGPYGGKYNFDASYVIVSKVSDEYRYFVQLIEQLPDGGFRGFALRSIESIEGKNYLNNYTINGVEEETLWEGATIPEKMKLSWDSDNLVKDSLKKTYLANRTPACMTVYVEKVVS